MHADAVEAQQRAIELNEEHLAHLQEQGAESDGISTDEERP